MANLVSLIIGTLPDMEPFERGYLLHRAKEIAEGAETLQDIDDRVHSILANPNSELGIFMRFANEVNANLPAGIEAALKIQDSCVLLRDLAYAYMVEHTFEEMRDDFPTLGLASNNGFTGRKRKAADDQSGGSAKLRRTDALYGLNLDA